MTQKLTNIAVGMAIRVVRERAQMSANDLALQVGMTPSSLSRTETGARAVELAEAVLIARLTGTTVADLVTVAAQMEANGYLRAREKALADLQLSKVRVKEMASVVLDQLKNQMREPAH